MPVSLMEQEAELSSLTYAERKKKISRDKRYARYEDVMALHRAGMGQRAIARQLRMSRKHRPAFLSFSWLPRTCPRHWTAITRRRASSIPICLISANDGTLGRITGSRLFGEIKERGYTGSESLLRHVLAEWRTELPPKPGKANHENRALHPQPRKRRLSSRSASFLMILPPAKQTQFNSNRLST